MSEDTLYKIKPFEWQGEIKKPGDVIRSFTPFGLFYTVECRHGHFRWIYYMGEGYGVSFPCPSVEEGKRLAFNHWLSCIKPSLVEVQT